MSLGDIQLSAVRIALVDGSPVNGLSVGNMKIWSQDTSIDVLVNGVGFSYEQTGRHFCFCDELYDETRYTYYKLKDLYKQAFGNITAITSVVDVNGGISAIDPLFTDYDDGDGQLRVACFPGISSFWFESWDRGKYSSPFSKCKTAIYPNLVSIPEEHGFFDSDTENLIINKIETLSAGMPGSLKRLDAKSLKNIGKLEFGCCENLIQLNAQQISQVGELAFTGCYSLPSLTALDTAEFGDDAFRDCSSLLSIDFVTASQFDIPTISQVSPFANVGHAVSCVIGATEWYELFTNENWKHSIDSGFAKAILTGDAATADLIIQNSLGEYRTFGGNRLMGQSEIKVMSSDADTVLEPYSSMYSPIKDTYFEMSFEMAHPATSAYIPGDISAVGEFAFAGMVDLVEVKLQLESIRCIKDYALSGCKNLSLVDIYFQNDPHIVSASEHSFDCCGWNTLCGHTMFNVGDLMYSEYQRAPYWREISDYIIGDTPHAVRFYDDGGTLIQEKTAYDHGFVTPPDVSRKYQYATWNGNYTDVTQDENVSAEWHYDSDIQFRMAQEPNFGIKHKDQISVMLSRDQVGGQCLSGPAIYQCLSSYMSLSGYELTGVVDPHGHILSVGQQCFATPGPGQCVCLCTVVLPAAEYVGARAFAGTSLGGSTWYNSQISSDQLVSVMLDSVITADNLAFADMFTKGFGLNLSSAKFFGEYAIGYYNQYDLSKWSISSVCLPSVSELTASRMIASQRGLSCAFIPNVTRIGLSGVQYPPVFWDTHPLCISFLGRNENLTAVPYIGIGQPDSTQCPYHEFSDSEGTSTVVSCYIPDSMYEAWKEDASWKYYTDRNIVKIINESYVPVAQYQVNLYCPAGGSIAGAVSGAYYDASTVLSLSVSADEGYYFYGWNDNVGDNPRVLSVSCDISLSADVQIYDESKGTADDIKQFNATIEKVRYFNSLSVPETLPEISAIMTDEEIWAVLSSRI